MPATLLPDPGRIVQEMKEEDGAVRGGSLPAYIIPIRHGHYLFLIFFCLVTQGERLPAYQYCASLSAAVL